MTQLSEVTNSPHGRVVSVVIPGAFVVEEGESLQPPSALNGNLKTGINIVPSHIKDIYSGRGRELFVLSNRQRPICRNER